MPDFSLLTDSLIELILCLAAFAFARFLHPRFFRGQESGRVVRQLSSRVRHHWPNSNISVKFHQTRSVKQPSHFWSLFLQHLDFAQLSKIIKTIYVAWHFYRSSVAPNSWKLTICYTGAADTSFIIEPLMGLPMILSISTLVKTDSPGSNEASIFHQAHPYIAPPKEGRIRPGGNRFQQIKEERTNNRRGSSVFSPIQTTILWKNSYVFFIVFQLWVSLIL